MTLQRPPNVWVDDLAWHRQMFNQSRLRWHHEDAIATALTFTRGRLEYRTLHDLARLTQQHLELLGHTDLVERAIAIPLRQVRGQREVQWDAALDILGLSAQAASTILWRGDAAGSQTIAEAVQVTRGLPWTTPLTETWELRQLAGLYCAAGQVLEDAICDLASELVTQWRDLLVVAPATTSRTPGPLLLRLEENRRTRGGRNDSRRRAEQVYEPSDIRPSATGSAAAR